VAAQITAYVGVTDRDWCDSLRTSPDSMRRTSGSRARPPRFGRWTPASRSSLSSTAPPTISWAADSSPVGRNFRSVWPRKPSSRGTAQQTSSRCDAESNATAVSGLRRGDDYEIGCILLEQPFFFEREDWLPVPEWQPNIVRGKGYDLTVEPGRTLWERVVALLRGKSGEALKDAQAIAKAKNHFGKPLIVEPRLGQGSFRVIVTDAYGRCCAATGERVLPVLEAAHIKPYSQGGEHRVDNGLLLRSDLHTLFDQGYVSVTPDYRLEPTRLLPDSEMIHRHLDLIAR
jgi:hypothetical protein